MLHTDRRRICPARQSGYTCFCDGHSFLNFFWLLKRWFISDLEGILIDLIGLWIFDNSLCDSCFRRTWIFYI
jgi:hypothetical protein